MGLQCSQNTVGENGDFQPLYTNISQTVSNMAMVTIKEIAYH